MSDILNQRVQIVKNSLERKLKAFTSNGPTQEQEPLRQRQVMRPMSKVITVDGDAAKNNGQTNHVRKDEREARFFSPPVAIFSVFSHAKSPVYSHASNPDFLYA